ncbi:MAG: SpoIIE family protein phosphatase [Candidatus Riflebacteria bacterium]|nr:SpoIIE family protein phosphatase [Candidatus Riflebacteria bacterium]
MSLQRRLTRGISAVLAVILVFMLLTSMSYWDIEGFVTSILPVNIAISRSYERIAGYWVQLAESAEESMSRPLSDSQETEMVTRADELIEMVKRLDNLVDDEERVQSLRSINNLSSAFIKQLDSFKLLLKNRNRALLRNSSRRAKAADGLRSEVVSLLDRFKSMMIDLNSTLKNPDFQASLGGTSTLMDKIARIEKDLILADTEVALYLSLKHGKETPEELKTGKNSAIRVENRLRAVMFLLERSVQESTTVLHKRVLAQVETKIRSFYESFQKLRNILEAPESDLIEFEDQLQQIMNELTHLRQQGVTLAISEAEIFWKRIFDISDQLQQHASNNHSLILAFLFIVLGFVIYLNIVFPKQIGGPLKKLSLEISAFELGSASIEIPHSGTEEIDSLGQAFQIMASRLNQQGEVNQKYLESIHSLTKVYRELHETTKRADSPNERLEKAVNMILEQLIWHCPGIDLVKVMVVKQVQEKQEPEKSSKQQKNAKQTKPEKYFARLGDPEFSDRFKASDEFAPYCESVGYMPRDTSQTIEERIPFDQDDNGVTGWYFENSLGIKTGSDGASFFQPIYKPLAIGSNPTLTDRKYEKGIKGGLVTEPLNLPVQGSEDLQEQRGLLFVYFLDPETMLSWQEIFFIQIIASQIASIIETDDLLQQHDLKKKMDDQLRMAKEIQENLLPQAVPEIKGLHISRISKSAEEVGGDYFDFFALGENRLGVVIADASGKNVPAAIIMTVFKTTLSTMALEKLSAKEVLSRANRIIAKNITTDRFITAMYVIINSETGEVELSSAGHNPAFVVTGRGMEKALHEKTSKGLPLGILEDYAYESVSFKLKKDDLLFLYTDGVTEARNHNEEEFGESGLKKFLARPRSQDPAGSLLEEVQHFSETAKQHDDITAVSIEYTGRG